MVIRSLSNGSRLTRVVVLDSLTKPMRYLLRQTIGCLLGRPIYFTPFSRKTKLDASVVEDTVTLQKECLHARGVLVTQPEHILVQARRNGAPLGRRATSCKLNFQSKRLV
jgi:Protein of unknown function (DUF3638)